MTFKTISISLALTCALATQAVAQTKSYSAAPTGPSTNYSFQANSDGGGMSRATGEGAHFECHWDKEHGMEFCDIIVIVCPEKDGPCVELP